MPIEYATDELASLGCQFHNANPSICFAICPRNEALSVQAVNRNADGTRRQEDLSSDRVYR